MRGRHLLLALAGALVTSAPAADFLPTPAQAEAAIAAMPMVRAAQARSAEARARGDALAANPYGFEFTLIPSARHEHAARRTYDEWEASLVRRLRLPDKAALDRALGASGVEAAWHALADARHAAARVLLEHWLAWLRAALQVRLAEHTLATLRAEEAAIATRVAAGDLAVLDGDRARAGRARSELVLRQARLARDQARIALVTQFPAIELPPGVPDIPPPAAHADVADAAAARVVERSHEIALALVLGQRQQLTAARADSERRADPSVGLRLLDETNQDQQVLGLVLSVPFAAPATRATAIAEGHLAAAAAATAEQVRQDVTRAARQLALAVPARAEAWQAAQAAQDAADTAFARVERAFTLGEAGYADLLLARRAQQDAAYEEILARLDAHQAHLELAIDTHELWSGHSAGHDAHGAH